MRSPILHRWLHAWACLAMLLVVVAPLISRAQAGHPDRMPDQASLESEPAAHARMHHDMPHGMDHDMPTPPGHTHAAPGKPGTEKSADPHAEHEMGVDCEYCLIAARMISLLVALLLLMSTWPAVFRAVAGQVDTRHARAPGTLGARGPPAIAC